MRSPLLFHEPGARWWALGYGPLLCSVIAVGEMLTGGPVHVVALMVAAVLCSGLGAVQIAAARRHTRVDMTADILRNGSESMRLDSIAEILPEADGGGYRSWQSARALGELSGVPRRRTAIGLRLTDGVVVQTWALDHRGLRTELEQALARFDRKGTQ